MKQGEIKKNKKKKRRILNTIVLSLLIMLLIVIAILGIRMYKKNSVENQVTGTKIGEMMDDTDTESTVRDQIKAEEAYIIETPYCDLYYPSKWQEQLRVEVMDGEAYTVNFYGTVEGKPEQPLFNISFGGDGEIAVGSFMTEQFGLDISMSFAEITIDESWSEEEANVIYAMQEDVNYLIGMLEQTEGFEPAA